MSIRILLCSSLVISFAIYAWRNWFYSLCMLILLMGLLEHRDMPKSILGIPGLNLWNLLLVNVLLAWRNQRRREQLQWDMPPLITGMLLLYGMVIITSFIRLFLDPAGLEGKSGSFLINDYLINPFKWIIPSLLIYDGCRSKSRAYLVLALLASLYLLFALQVIYKVPLSYAMSSGDLSRAAYRKIESGVGYNRVDMSMMLAGASWATVSMVCLLKARSHKVMLLCTAGVIALGQALTGGRAGYVTWGAIGFIFCLIRWHRALPIMLVAPLIVAMALPGVADRMLQGLGGDSTNTDREAHYEITSGRTIMWPYVIEKIKNSPLIGYGRHAMIRTGLTSFMFQEYRESFGHPHNAYLECVLDNGLLGFSIVMSFYLLLLRRGFKLFRDKIDPLASAIGGTGLALVLALMIASMGSQTFYPREGVVGMWVAIGLVLRYSVSKCQSEDSMETHENSDLVPVGTN